MLSLLIVNCSESGRGDMIHESGRARLRNDSLTCSIQPISPLWAPALLAALMTACSGGGRRIIKPKAPTITITASPPAVVAAAATNGTAPSPSNVTVKFSNAPSTVYFMDNDYSTNGISSVSMPVFNATGGSFVVNFQSPSGLKPATYTDTDTLLLCSDPQCQTVLAKYPLAVNYSVTSSGSAPQVSLNSTSLNISALTIDQGEVPGIPDPSQFTFANFTVAPYVQLSAPTTGGISSLNFVMSDATHGGIAFVMQQPSMHGAGTYTTTIEATVCLDSSCVNPVAAGKFSITLTYAVGNTVTMAGTNGYTMTFFPATALALAGYAVRSVIYASISSTAANNPSTIEALNP